MALDRDNVKICGYNSRLKLDSEVVVQKQNKLLIRE